MKKSIFINDVFVFLFSISPPFHHKIIKELESKKRRGYKIKGMEVDDIRNCIIYREPNNMSNIHNM